MEFEYSTKVVSSKQLKYVDTYRQFCCPSLSVPHLLVHIYLLPSNSERMHEINAYSNSCHFEYRSRSPSCTLRSPLKTTKKRWVGDRFECC